MVSPTRAAVLMVCWRSFSHNYTRGSKISPPTRRPPCPRLSLDLPPRSLALKALRQ